jgi:hypothetical protein
MSPARRAVTRLPFAAPVAGWSHHAGAVESVAAGDAVMAVHEPTCLADLCAVAVHADGRRVGYLPRRLAADVIASFGAGAVLGGVVTSLDASGRPHVELRVLASRRAPVPVGASLRTRSGLLVGELVEHRGATVEVRTGDGRLVSYPAGHVTVTGAPSDEAAG